MAKSKRGLTRDFLTLTPSEDMLVDRLIWVSKRLREVAEKIDRHVLEYRMGDIVDIRTLLRNPMLLFQEASHAVLWMVPNLGLDTCMPIVSKAESEIEQAQAITSEKEEENAPIQETEDQ